MESEFPRVVDTHCDEGVGGMVLVVYQTEPEGSGEMLVVHGSAYARAYVFHKHALMVVVRHRSEHKIRWSHPQCQ